MWKEFKGFIANDNVVTMATGIILGSAFTAIVTSLVDNIFMPLIVALTGQADVSGLAFKIGSAEIGYGSFIQAIINFILIGGFLFLTLKALEKAQNKKIISPDEEPAGPSEVELLQEILTELKMNK
ncbi:large conductance mechanosensitive channel protein MscL [Facklamia miroungae]|uniref:Large-conductance mechanosensitive channel n=1 Tax=Facklamia miroungae TaxID=120956 RepID=A0A1G7SLP6_9LACT|nr:large conductance mechanosensitive channel protein MscL [Facklamia miroungae]NKZ29608.1 large conductance mechanosensitive channel protein MscL [Facklamia miroungae]SDG23976.1 large conductance mechanosensitive channel [Facklamia miroungae]